jgi:hypothetical protein
MKKITLLLFVVLFLVSLTYVVFRGMLATSPANAANQMRLAPLETSAEIDGAEFEGDVERGIFTIDFTIQAGQEALVIADKVSLDPEDPSVGFFIIVHDEFGPMYPGHTIGWLGFIEESSLEAQAGSFTIPGGQTARFKIRFEIRDALGMRGVEFRGLRFRVGSSSGKAKSLSFNEGTFLTKRVLLDNDHLRGVPKVRNGQLLIE